MKTDKAKVHYKEKYVGDATYKVYDTLEEAGVDMGTATALKVLNTQVKTKAMNDFRKTFEPQESKTALRSKAMTMVKPDEWVAAAGDQARIDEVINKYLAQLENEKAASEPSKDEATDNAAAEEQSA